MISPSLCSVDVLELEFFLENRAVAKTKGWLKSVWWFLFSNRSLPRRFVMI